MPLSGVIEAGNTAAGLVGGLIDRWAAAKLAKIDSKALVRLVLLEARRNLEVLGATVGQEDMKAEALWEVPQVLSVEAIEMVLGLGEAASGSFKQLTNLVVTKSDNEERDAGGFLVNLYVRTAALRSLSLLNSKEHRDGIRIRLRLTNLRKDLILMVKALAEA